MDLIRPRKTEGVVSRHVTSGDQETIQLSDFNQECRSTLSNEFILRCPEGNSIVAVVVDGETEV